MSLLVFISNNIGPLKIYLERSKFVQVILGYRRHHLCRGNNHAYIFGNVEKISSIE